jgi:hypothetical protein
MARRSRRAAACHRAAVGALHGAPTRRCNDLKGGRSPLTQRATGERWRARCAVDGLATTERPTEQPPLGSHVPWQNRWARVGSASRARIDRPSVSLRRRIKWDMTSPHLHR